MLWAGLTSGTLNRIYDIATNYLDPPERPCPSPYL